MRYTGNIFRPFSEANSYLLQCTIGCSHNHCTFCGMYKDQKFKIRPLEEIKTDIRMAKAHYGDLEKVFLCDGDAIVIPTDILLEILQELYHTFPSLRHVGLYVGPTSTLEKSLSELSALRAAGLTKAYLGVETGDNDLLKSIKKGVDATQMRDSGLHLIQAGINLSAMVLLGIAGPGAASEKHALATAQICNEMKPHYLAALTVTPVPGTVLFHQVEKGDFKLLEPFETLQEMKWIFENITVDPLKFVGTHASNYLYIKGTLQKDKHQMIQKIDDILSNENHAALRSEHMRGL
ncbi:MAG: radical SAM domain-containing protein [Candidatus Magnetoglobus multicellularis str. Araruama]|uniref:Radical SAM domain-containing protein n=1 Tax=Candidatus Magnetoglobus multicellularis str. Araruama TaxID=890399 RepID=A0A1V1P952_9BACT|nr:MAG: radical SAM domain-containing protein [Candidatus Magnetoglobus multicellularis str. Araruama]